MSDWAEKLASPSHQREGRAQATRKGLLARRGSRELDSDTIHIDTMGGREVWRRVQKKTGKAAGDFFEQEVRS